VKILLELKEWAEEKTTAEEKDYNENLLKLKTLNREVKKEKKNKKLRDLAVKMLLNLNYVEEKENYRRNYEVLKAQYRNQTYG
jgi:hypothetical protein